jgi:2-polyprenyl-3-methyl-5-hydroxy-6-metoxy-1,4-benzoquinol methylase
MINYLHSRLHRPEKGWDPVPKSHADNYAEKEWGKIEATDMEELESRFGGFSGKRILDLGGGAGQYSIAFAKRGAIVTWHDISINYRRIVQGKADELGLELKYSLGYLEDAAKFGVESFDIVFCRICWYYCRNDGAFARMILGLLKRGGLAYINSPTSRGRPQGGALQRVQSLLYRSVGFKIGHPFPPPGRVPALFAALSPARLEVDFSSGKNDKILVLK